MTYSLQGLSDSGAHLITQMPFLEPNTLEGDPVAEDSFQ